MRSPFAIKLTDRKVALLKVLLAHHETSIRDQLTDRKVASLKVLLAYHETSIRDQTGRPKGGFAQGALRSP